jgi:hypothetical protein
MTAGSVRQGGNLMRVPSSPRLNPPFDGGRTAPLAGLAHSPMNIGPYIVPLAMLAIAFMLIAAALWL